MIDRLKVAGAHVRAALILYHLVALLYYNLPHPPPPGALNPRALQGPDLMAELEGVAGAVNDLPLLAPDRAMAVQDLVDFLPRVGALYAQTLEFFRPHLILTNSAQYWNMFQGVGRFPETVRILGAADGEGATELYRYHSSASEWLSYDRHSKFLRRLYLEESLEYAGLARSVSAIDAERHYLEFWLSRWQELRPGSGPRCVVVELTRVRVPAPHEARRGARPIEHGEPEVLGELCRA